MALIPYPSLGLRSDSITTWSDSTVNWVDYSGEYGAHTHRYEVIYHKDDILAALSLVRVYFILKAIMTQLPLTTLYATRKCEQVGFTPNFAF